MGSDLYTTMARRPPLSEDENVRLNEATGAGKTVTQICSKLSRSRMVINNYLLSTTTNGTRKPSGRPRTISAVAFRNINRSMSNNPTFVRAIAAEMPFTVSHQKAWRGLAREGRYTYSRLKTTIFHTADHKVKRVLWKIDHIG